MTSGRPSSAPSSERTSSAKPATPIGESQFLTDQANQASAAISGAISQIKQDLVKGNDPRYWAKERPWMTVAAAAVGGFVAATVAVPSKEEQALKRLAKLERALHPEA